MSIEKISQDIFKAKCRFCGKEFTALHLAQIKEFYTSHLEKHLLEAERVAKGKTWKSKLARERIINVKKEISEVLKYSVQSSS